MCEYANVYARRDIKEGEGGHERRGHIYTFKKIKTCKTGVPEMEYAYHQENSLVSGMQRINVSLDAQQRTA